MYAWGNDMKKTGCIVALLFFTITLSCTKDYRKAVVGKWNAGMATMKSDMIVTIKDDGTFTAEISGYDMKPVPGTYRFKNERIYFSFPKIVLSYRIISLEGDTLVMKSKYARITWQRLK